MSSRKGPQLEVVKASCQELLKGRQYIGEARRRLGVCRGHWYGTDLGLGTSWNTEELGTLPPLITTSGLRPGTALQAYIHSSKVRHRLYFNTIYMRVHNSVRHTHVAAATAADSTAADSTVHEAVLTQLAIASYG